MKGGKMLKYVIYSLSTHIMTTEYKITPSPTDGLVFDSASLSNQSMLKTQLM